MVEISARRRKGVCRMEIVGDMTIYEALEIKKKLLSSFDKAQEMEVNLSGVSEIDSTGVQLLMLVKMESQRQGKKLRLTAHSEATLKVLDTLSLSAFFGDPVLISADDSPLH